MTLDSNIILSFIIIVSIIILIIYEIAKYNFKNNYKIWVNAYELLKERNEQLQNEKSSLEGQIDCQYEAFQNEIKELENKYKSFKKS